MPITSHTNLIDGQLYYPGQIVKATPEASILTGINAEASTVIPFGFGVVKGTSDDDLILPVDANSVFRGVAVIQNIEKRASYSLDASSRFGCPVDHELAFAIQGVIAVYVDQTVTQGGAVYLRHTANSSVVGTFRADADTANALLISGAKWGASVTVSSGLGIAPVILNTP